MAELRVRARCSPRPGPTRKVGLPGVTRVAVGIVAAPCKAAYNLFLAIDDLVDLNSSGRLPLGSKRREDESRRGESVAEVKLVGRRLTLHLRQNARVQAECCGSLPATRRCRSLKPAWGLPAPLDSSGGRAGRPLVACALHHTQESLRAGRGETCWGVCVLERACSLICTRRKFCFGRWGRPSSRHPRKCLLRLRPCQVVEMFLHSWRSKGGCGEPESVKPW